MKRRTFAAAEAAGRSLAVRAARRSLLKRAVVFGAVAAIGLAGCGGGDDALPSDPNQVSGKVTMWSYPIGDSGTQEYWKPRVDAFKKKYPNVDVQVVVHPWAKRDEQLVTAIAGKQAPDVVYLIPDQVPKYASMKALAPVDDVISDDKSDFRDVALKAMTFEDKLYGVPFLQSVNTTVYNKKVLQAAGVASPPKTWDEVLAAAPQLKAAGYYTTVYEGGLDSTLNQTFYPLLWQAGGEVLNEDGTKAAFNSDAGRKALEFIKKLVDGGYVPKANLTATVPQEQSDLVKGKVALTYASGIAILTAEGGLPAEDLQIGAPLKQEKEVSYGTVGGLSLLAGSENKAAAKAWIRWMTEAAQMGPFCKENDYYAPRKSVTNLYQGDALRTEEEKYLDAMNVGVLHPKARDMMGAITPQIQAVLLGKATPADALAKAEKDVNDLLAR